QSAYHSPFLRRAVSRKLLPFFKSVFCMLNCPTNRSNSATRSANSFRSLPFALSNISGALLRKSLRHLYTSESVTPRSRHIWAIGFSPPSTSITVSNLNCALYCRCLRAILLLHRLLYPFSFLCPTSCPHYRLRQAIMGHLGNFVGLFFS